MESTVVPISEILQKGAWHYQPYSKAVRETEAVLQQSPYPIIPLRELVQNVKHGFLQRSHNHLTEGIPVIRLKNLTFLGLNLADVVYISPEDHQKLYQTQLHQGDVLVGLSAASGFINTAVYESDQPANINQSIARLSLTNNINSNYLVNYLKSEMGQTLLQSHLMGAVIKTISINALMELPIICPPLKEQERIVSNVKSLQQQAAQHSQQSEALQREANQTFDYLLRQGAA
jgi:type I restriction enzyme, S subunit